jgi:hypothetical protein
MRTMTTLLLARRSTPAAGTPGRMKLRRDQREWIDDDDGHDNDADQASTTTGTTTTPTRVRW